MPFDVCVRTGSMDGVRGTTTYKRSVLQRAEQRLSPSPRGSLCTELQVFRE